MVKELSGEIELNLWEFGFTKNAQNNPATSSRKKERNEKRDGEKGGQCEKGIL